MTDQSGWAGAGGGLGGGVDVGVGSASMGGLWPEEGARGQGLFGGFRFAGEMDRARGGPLAEGDRGGVEVGEGNGDGGVFGRKVAGAGPLALEALLPGLPGV